ncbi:hypothetical protein CH75_09545 [Dyella jiangningensis]|nr:hypothetical protein CH75_08980 [Dyella jiangningensis]AHX13426.1 hypothetical protein CH75_09545 [Dyella jiangningensis]
MICLGAFRYTTRRRLSWLIAVLLLWQQFTVAAYACAMTPELMDQVMAMPGPAAMATTDGTCPEMRGHTDQALCQKHCLPDRTTLADSRAGTVPPSLLPALSPATVSLSVERMPTRVVLDCQDRRRSGNTPPTLLFCSLLI